MEKTLAEKGIYPGSSACTECIHFTGRHCRIGVSVDTGTLLAGPCPYFQKRDSAVQV